MDVTELLRFVPKAGSGDYQVKSAAGKKRGYNLRRKVLGFVSDIIQNLNIIDEVRLFFSELFDVSFNFRFKSVFLRYYNSETGSLSMPWHVDSALATVIITLPSFDFVLEETSHLEVIDPSFLSDKSFLHNISDKIEFSSRCEALKNENEAYFTIHLDVFDIFIMANPMPHCVSQIRKGDRLTVVLFLTPQ